jgi:type IV pilus assembly protein PilO
MASLKKAGAVGLDNLSLPGKVAVGVLFALMVGAAYFVVFYGEIDGNIATAQQTKTARENELKSMEDADRAYNKDLTEVERRKQIAAKQKTILPDDAEWAPFLDTLQRSATISGVTLSSWDPQDEVAESFFVRVPMRIKVRGRYHQIAKFFHTVGQTDRIINMTNIELVLDKQAKDKRAQTAEASGINEGEESVVVNVQAMATAFRAVRAGEGGDGGDRRGRRGRTGKAN